MSILAGASTRSCSAYVTPHTFEIDPNPRVTMSTYVLNIVSMCVLGDGNNENQSVIQSQFLLVQLHLSSSLSLSVEILTVGCCWADFGSFVDSVVGVFGCSAAILAQ